MTSVWILLIVAVVLLSLSIYLLGPDIAKFLTSLIPKTPTPEVVKTINTYNINCDGLTFSIDVQKKTIEDLSAASYSNINIPYIWESNCDTFSINVNGNGGASNLNLELYCGTQMLWNYKNSTSPGYSILYTCEKERIKAMLINS
jgi:hypothetical protein